MRPESEKGKHMLRQLMVCLGLIFVSWTTAYGATVEALGPQALAERSEQIFIGVVKGQETYAQRTPAQVWTRTVFEVERSIKGPTLPEIVIEQLGGVHGTGADRLEQVVHGYPHFRVGERVLLFLERADTGRLVVTGMAQGKYTLTPGGTTGGIIASRDVSDLALRGVRHAADAHVAGVPRNHDELLLTHLETLIDGLRPTPIPLMVRPQTPVSPKGGLR